MAGSTTLPKLVLVDNVKEITAKKTCGYGDFGSFEHLLVLLLLSFTRFSLYIIYIFSEKNPRMKKGS